MDTPHRPPRGPNALPTVPERRALLLELKARALGGDTVAAAALMTAELTTELRRARGTIRPEISTDAR